MKTGKSLTFRSILISYLVLCLAMLTVTIIGYSSSIFYVQKEIRNSAALRMREVVGKIENNIRLSYQLCDTLAVSGGLDDIALYRRKFFTTADFRFHETEKYNVRIECTEQSLSESAYLFSEERFHSFFQFAASRRKRGYQLFLPTVWYHCTGFLLLDDRRKSKILSGFIR